jgi:DNA-binding beta-propeller fold protein YncE
MDEEGGLTLRRLSRNVVRLFALTLSVVAPVVALVPVPVPASAAAPRALAPGTVFVTSLGVNTVTAINPVNHQITVVRGAGRGLNGPLGIAIAPDGRTAYVTNSLGNTVTSLDLTTNPPSIGRSIRVGDGPSAIAIAPDGRAAYVTNFNANTVTPINLATSPPTPGSPIPVGAGPWSIAVSPNGRVVCVSNSEGTTVSVIATGSNSVTTIAVGSRPQAIAITPNGATAYVASGNAVTPINLRASPPAAQSPIPVGNGPLGLAIAPDGRTAYTANTDNTVTRIDLRVHPAVPATPITVGTLTQPDGIAISPDGLTAYAANASNTVTPINLRTNPPSPEAPFQVGSATFGIAVAPGQAPVAHLVVTSAPAGKPTIFDASSSSATGGRIAHYTWNFGDGTVVTTSVARTTHVYSHAGSYVASVTEKSADGTSTGLTFTGQTVSNNGNRSARSAHTVHVTSALRMTPPSGPPGIAVSLRDDTFSETCRPVYVFFDGRLIAQTAPIGQLLLDRRLVIPGDATLGWHQLELSCSTTSTRWLLTTRFDVVNTNNHLSEFSVAMPGPTELGKHLAASGGISIAMLLLSRIIAAGFPSEWLDSTYEANRERIQARFRRRYPKLFIDRDKPKSTRRRFLGGLAIFLGFLFAAGVINSFLDPKFGFNRTTLWLFLGQCVGVGIVTLTSQMPILFGGLHEKRKVHLQVLIGGLLIAVVCVAASRALGLSPGYCYGLIAVFLLRPHVTDREWGKLHFIASVCVLVVASAAFFLTVPVFHAATQVNPSPIWLVLNPALNVVFLGGFASLAFGMFPLPFLPGRHVANWNRTAWLIMTVIGLVGFVAVLLSPGSGSANEIKHVALVPLLIAFVGFAIFSLVVMLYFHRHPVPPTDATSAVHRDGAANAEDVAEADRQGEVGLPGPETS